MSESADLDNPYTRGMAEFVSGLTYDAVPDEVRTRIKLLILDALGCGLYAADLPWSRILIETLAAGDSSDSAGVWGTNLRLSPAHAALANGALVQGFELDDVHRQGVLHVGAVTLPALMAVTELKPISPHAATWDAAWCRRRWPWRKKKAAPEKTCSRPWSWATTSVPD